jgi:magnesium chelatase family protein
LTRAAFDRPGNYAIAGELVLTGETRPVRGILSMAIQSVAKGRDGLLVPTANAAEAAIVEGLNEPLPLRVTISRPSMTR